MFYLLADAVLKGLNEEQLARESEVEGINLEKIDNHDSIFNQRLKKKKPKVYRSYGDIFNFFNYEDDVEEARTESRNKTANLNIASYQFYSLKNVLILHQFPGG